MSATWLAFEAIQWRDALLFLEWATTVEIAFSKHSVRARKSSTSNGRRWFKSSSKQSSACPSPKCCPSSTPSYWSTTMLIAKAAAQSTATRVFRAAVSRSFKWLSVGTRVLKIVSCNELLRGGSSLYSRASNKMQMNSEPRVWIRKS